jgi:hypothetical protein
MRMLVAIFDNVKSFSVDSGFTTPSFILTTAPKDYSRGGVGAMFVVNVS